MAFSARNSPIAPGSQGSCSPADAEYGNRAPPVRPAPPRARKGSGPFLALGQVRLLGQGEPARLGRAAGEAGARERAGDVATGAVGRRGQLRALGGAVAGDV